MPQVQDRSLDLTTCSPVCYHYATAAPYYMKHNHSIYVVVILVSSVALIRHYSLYFDNYVICTLA